VSVTYVDPDGKGSAHWVWPDVASVASDAGNGDRAVADGADPGRCPSWFELQPAPLFTAVGGVGGRGGASLGMQQTGRRRAGFPLDGSPHAALRDVPSIFPMGLHILDAESGIRVQLRLGELKPPLLQGPKSDGYAGIGTLSGGNAWLYYSYPRLSVEGNVTLPPLIAGGEPQWEPRHREWDPSEWDPSEWDPSE
jgi:hypothetical protein